MKHLSLEEIVKIELQRTSPEKNWEEELLKSNCRSFVSLKLTLEEKRPFLFFLIFVDLEY